MNTVFVWTLIVMFHASSPHTNYDPTRAQIIAIDNIATKEDCQDAARRISARMEGAEAHCFEIKKAR